MIKVLEFYESIAQFTLNTPRFADKNPEEHPEVHLVHFVLLLSLAVGMVCIVLAEEGLDWVVFVEHHAHQ